MRPALVYLLSLRGTKSWLLRYQRAGRERWMGLGPTHVFSLEESCERARQARQIIRERPAFVERNLPALRRAAEAMDKVLEARV